MFISFSRGSRFGISNYACVSGVLDGKLSGCGVIVQCDSACAYAPYTSLAHPPSHHLLPPPHPHPHPHPAAGPVCVAATKALALLMVAAAEQLLPAYRTLAVTVPGLGPTPAFTAAAAVDWAVQVGGLGRAGGRGSGGREGRSWVENRHPVHLVLGVL